MTKYLLMLFLLFGLIDVQAQDVSNDDIIATLMESTESELVQQMVSEDGLDRIEVVKYSCTAVGEEQYAYEQLNIIDNDTNEANLISEMRISCGGLGAIGFWVQQWSGQYIYFHDAREGSPDGLVGNWTPSIQRVMVSGIEVESIDNLGPAHFSPDRLWLVTWDPDHVRIITTDNTESAEFELTPNDMFITNVIWLPDGSGLLYIQADAPFMSTQSSVTHIDIKAMEQTVLLDNR